MAKTERFAALVAGLALVLSAFFASLASAQVPAPAEIPTAAGTLPRATTVGPRLDGETAPATARAARHVAGIAPAGYPGWVQVNEDGFGSGAFFISTLASFENSLYAGTWDGLLWRTGDGQTWAQVTPSWPATPPSMYDAEVHDGQLYFGVDANGSAEVWRTDGTNWERVFAAGSGDATNVGVNALQTFQGALYALTVNLDTGQQIWRSATGDSGDWTQVFSDGPQNQDATMDTFHGHLYAGWSRDGVAELWRTADGASWLNVFDDGLAPNNTNVSSMAEFGGAFYIGLRNTTTGGEIWRSTDGLVWESVMTGGFGDVDNGRPYGLIVHDENLYLVLCNLEAGAEVWRSADGTNWAQVAEGGWGDSNNGYGDYVDKAAAVFEDRLYIGTFNWETGGEVWKRTVTADFAASPRLGPPPLSVQFTNLSGGDYTTLLWDFGDGATSTEQNPAHVYAGGRYDVSLTVGDGVETSTLARPRYISAVDAALFLPQVGRDYHAGLGTWQVYAGPTASWLTRVSMVDAGDGWAVARDGTIYHFDGSAWQQAASPTSEGLYGLDMVDAQNGWAVGTGGTILHYSAGVWRQVSSPVTSELDVVEMVSASEGWAMGISDILHYAGGRWQVVGSTPGYMVSMDIVARDDIWATGTTLMHYDGLSWSEATTPGFGFSNGIAMLGAQDGWAGSTELWRFDGANWIYRKSPVGSSLAQMAKTGSGRIWAVGWDGVIAHFDGMGWMQVESPTTRHLWGVDFVDDTEGWAVGEGGAFLHYTASGAP